MKKKVLCMLLALCLFASFTLTSYAMLGPIDADDEAELISPTLEVSTVPTGAVAVARNLTSNETYYYRVNGTILPTSDDGIISEPGWMPDVASTNIIIDNDGDEIPEESRTLVSNTQVAPYSAIGLLIIAYETREKIFIRYGTATMISSNAAVTAAHCLYNSSLGWPSSVLFVPGINGPSSSPNMPYGFAVAAEIAISTPYYYDPVYSLHDWGVIRFATNIGNNCGYLGFQYWHRDMSDFSAMISGYPGDLNGFDAATETLDFYNQYKAINIISSDNLGTTTCSNNTTYDWRVFGCLIDATSGQSGSPLLYRSSTQDAYQIIGVYIAAIGANENGCAGLTSQLFSFLFAYKNNS